MSTKYLQRELKLNEQNMWISRSVNIQGEKHSARRNKGIFKKRTLSYHWMVCLVGHLVDTVSQTLKESESVVFAETQ